MKRKSQPKENNNTRKKQDVRFYYFSFPFFFFFCFSVLGFFVFVFVLFCFVFFFLSAAKLSRLLHVLEKRIALNAQIIRNLVYIDGLLRKPENFKGESCSEIALHDNLTVTMHNSVLNKSIEICDWLSFRKRVRFVHGQSQNKNKKKTKKRQVVLCSYIYYV